MSNDDDHRRGKGQSVFAVGLFRNLSRQSDYETAILENLSREGFLAEISSRPNLQDAVELIIDAVGLVLLGEVVQFRPSDNRWLADVKIRHPLDVLLVDRAIAGFRKYP